MPEYSVPEHSVIVADRSGQLAYKCGRRRSGHTHFHKVAHSEIAARENAGLVLLRAPYPLLGAALGYPLDKHLENLADITPVGLGRKLVLKGNHAVEALYLHLLGHIIRHLARGQCAGTLGVFEHKCRVESRHAHQFERLPEILLAFIVESGKEVGGNAAVGYSLAYSLNTPHVPLAGVLAVHGLQHAVGARLHRQMDVVADIGMRGNDGDGVVRHIFGMRGGEAHAHVGSILGHKGKQPGKIHGFSGRFVSAAVGVDILTQQRDLAEPFLPEVGDLSEYAFNLAAALTAAGIRHNTV